MLKLCLGLNTQSLWILTLIGVGAAAIGLAATAAADVILIPAPERLDFEVEERLQPGLILEFHQQLDGRKNDARTARLPALLVADGEPPTPFLSAGPFSAVFRGYLFPAISGNYTFHFAGQGTAILRVNGQEVLRGEGDLSQTPPVTVELYGDYTPIELHYEALASGAAELRLAWEGLAEQFSGDDVFTVEPLPPGMLWHDPADSALVGPGLVRRGRELFANLNCMQCHALPGRSGQHERWMPELSRKNPDLGGVAQRLKSNWVYRWIQNPQSLRNHVTMPQVFGAELDAAQEQDLVDLIAFLNSLTAGRPGDSQGEDSSSPELIEAGEILYENLGCIACHRFTPPADEDYYKRTSLFHVDAKYRPGALIAFLQAPHANYLHSRMPDFRLAADEAARLASFLRAQSQEVLEAPASILEGHVAAGRRVYKTKGCAACHGVPTGDGPTFDDTSPIELTTATRGCLALDEKERGTSPVFQLNANELDSLRTFVSSGTTFADSLLKYVPVEASERYIARLRCAVCHQRDGQFSILSEVLIEEGVQGLPPEAIPALTWAGEKLHRDWIRTLLAGELDYRARPWLKARMPAFPGYAEPLATGLPRMHGFFGTVRSQPKPDADLAVIGQRLTQQFTGFYCTECHASQGRPPTSAFDHRGIDFPYVTKRLQYDYYQRWMHDPQRIDPGTKMPQFAKQPRPDVLGGDVDRQFDALWHFLQSLE